MFTRGVSIDLFGLSGQATNSIELFVPQWPFLQQHERLELAPSMEMPETQGREKH